MIVEQQSSRTTGAARSSRQIAPKELGCRPRWRHRTHQPLLRCRIERNARDEGLAEQPMTSRRPAGGGAPELGREVAPQHTVDRRSTETVFGAEVVHWRTDSKDFVVLGVVEQRSGIGLGIRVEFGDSQHVAVRHLSGNENAGQIITNSASLQKDDKTGHRSRTGGRLERYIAVANPYQLGVIRRQARINIGDDAASSIEPDEATGEANAHHRCKPEAIGGD